MIDSLLSSITQNDFFSGGLVLLIFGAAVSQIPRAYGLVVRLFLRYFTTVVEIRNRYIIYWVDQYLQTTHPYGRTCRLLMGSISIDGGDNEVVLGPGTGRHLIHHHRSWFVIDRFRDKGDGGQDSLLIPQEVLVVRSLGRSREPLLQLLAEVREDHETRRNRDPRSLLHINARSGDWIPLRIGSPRPLETVVLDDGIKEDIIGGVRTYLSDHDYHKTMGIPYRYGISLEGPPGSGKSSLAKAIAAEFDLPLYVLDLKMPLMSDFDLVYLFSSMPFRSLLLIEDIDCDGLRRGTKTTTGDRESQISLKGLLNAIDGPNAAEGRVLVVTTNHPEELDAALVRPGRLDRRYHLGDATPAQAERLFQRFFPEANGRSEAFGRMVGEGTSMAELQRILMTCRDDADAAVESLGKGSN